MSETGFTARYVSCASADGLALLGRVWEPAVPAQGLPLVCLPGFTRNWRDFADLAATLATAGRRVVALDFRGRGGSSFGPSATYRPPNEARDVLAMLDHLGIARAHLLGTSRGGIVTMLLAMIAAPRLAGAILNDVGPVLEREGLVRIATQMRRTAPPSWEAAVGDLKAGGAAFFPRLDDAAWERFARQLYLDDAGVPYLPYDPALVDGFRSVAELPEIPSFWAGFDALKGHPVLVLRGARTDLLSPAALAEMAARFEGVSTFEVPDEGHAPLLWDGLTQEAIAAFLARADAA